MSWHFVGFIDNDCDCSEGFLAIIAAQSLPEHCVLLLVRQQAIKIGCKQLLIDTFLTFH